MSIEHCSARHRCADGGSGECSAIAGHYGRHVCSRCLSPFTEDQSDAPAQAPPAVARAAAAGGGQVAGKATEYACAHCGKNYAIEDHRCIYCDNLMCLSCNSANCPRVSLKCAHCGKPIPTITHKWCGYCGFRICDICPEEGCPKPAHGFCRHCGRPIRKYEAALCYCGYEIHPGCEALCPQKPPRTAAGTVQPPRRMVIPKQLIQAGVQPLMGYACPHCGRGFESSEDRWLCYCNEMVHKDCLEKCPSRPKGPKCCHCGREITSDQERWACWCNDVAHKECLGKCPSRPKEAAATRHAPARLDVPQVAAPVDYLCAHCGHRYADDNNKCVYCGKLLCYECRDTRCPWWH